MLEIKKRLFRFSLFGVLAIYMLLIAAFVGSYKKNFLSFGDGIQYASIAKEFVGLNDENLNKYLDLNAPIRTDVAPLVPINEYLRTHNSFAYGLKIIKDLNLGFLPGFLTGYFLPTDEKFINYYFGQSATYFFALLLSYLYLCKHEQIDKASLRNVFVASLLAPYMLVIGAYPTKYLMIYVALFLSINLLYVATVTQGYRDILIFFGSLLVLFLMKFQLALLLVALSLVVLWLRIRKSIFVILLLLGIGFLFFEMDYFVKLYSIQSNDGAGRKFEMLYDNIVLKIIIKYIMCAFGEFPWEGLKMHPNIAIAITGSLAPLVIIFQVCNFALNSAGYDEITSLKYESFIGWIALILSFQIFWGKTGFLEYSAIFFPFVGIRVERRNVALPLLVSVLSFLTILIAKSLWI